MVLCDSTFIRPKYVPLRPIQCLVIWRFTKFPFHKFKHNTSDRIACTVLKILPENDTLAKKDYEKSLPQKTDKGPSR